MKWWITKPGAATPDQLIRLAGPQDEPVGPGMEEATRRNLLLARLEDLLAIFTPEQVAILETVTLPNESVQQACTRMAEAACRSVRNGVQLILLDDRSAFRDDQGWVDPLLAIASVDQALQLAFCEDSPRADPERSFLATLTGDTDPSRDDIYSEYYNAMPWHPKDVNPQTTMLRTERYKLALSHSDADAELYDLDADPHELTNLWSRPEMEAVKLDLMRRMINRMAWTVDPLPIRRSEY